MIVVKANQANHTIELGMQGENESRVVHVRSIEEWKTDFGDGTAFLAYARPGAKTPYLVEIEVVDNVVQWVPNNADTAKNGTGFAQLSYCIGNKNVKSETYKVFVGESIFEGPNPPAGEDNWLEKIQKESMKAIEAAAQAEQAKVKAEAANGESLQNAQVASGASAEAVKAKEDSELAAKQAKESASQYPKIINGTWWVWDAAKGDYADTGVSASGGGGTKDYAKLENKPQINSVELNDNKTLEELGIQPKGDYLTEESDPSVPAWAKQPSKPAYTAEEVGAADASTVESKFLKVNASVFGLEYPFSEKGFYFDTGKLADAEGALKNGRNTGKIDCTKFSHVSVYTSLNVGGCAVAFFDEKGIFMPESSINGEKNRRIYDATVPEGAKYCAASYYYFSSVTPKCVFKNREKTVDESLEYNSRVATENKEDISKNWDNISELYGKVYGVPILFDKSGYIRTPDGLIVETPNAQHTDYINVTKFKYMSVVASISSSGYVVAFYDAGKKILQDISITGHGLYEVNKQRIPDTAVYVIVSNYGKNPAKLTLQTDEATLANRIETTANNKQLLIFGDSITDCCHIDVDVNDRTTSYYFRTPSNSYVNSAGETVRFSMWPKIINDFEWYKEIRNYALAGATYKTATRTEDNKRQNLQYQIDVAFNDLDNPNGAFKLQKFEPDIVIFALGTNDGVASNDTFESAMKKTVLKSDGYTIDLDATLKNLDASKFCESARLAYLRIKQKFPEALILVVLPIQRVSLDITSGTMYDNLTRIAKRCGAIPIEGATLSGIIREGNTLNAPGATLKDGLHPNEKGQNLMARMIIKAINDNYMPLDEMNV